MKLSDIDKESFFGKKEAVVYEPKTKKERIVQFGEVGTAYLRLYFEHIRPKAEQRRAPGQDASLEAAPLFITGREHGRIDVQYVNRVLKKFALKAGIKKNVSSHSFRHSYGTHILENGAGIKEVSELLGHDSIETTQGYTRLAPERLRETLLKYHPREKA
jgi:site-specific recombinase XerD